LEYCLLQIRVVFPGAALRSKSITPVSPYGSKSVTSWRLTLLWGSCGETCSVDFGLYRVYSLSVSLRGFYSRRWVHFVIFIAVCWRNDHYCY